MIRVADLSYTYPKAERPALQDFTFEVSPGEVVGLLGPSGAGKSTTQNILIGLLKDYRGQVQVMDKEMKRWGPDFFERVGVSFELPNHYLKLTARENLDYFRALYSGGTAEPEALLDRVGLLAAIDTRVSDFSKGMKQRLTLARSMLNQPELWFLDEPTSGLDPVNARNVMDIVKEKTHAGTTVLITTHNMMVADQLCDRVGFVVDGRLVTLDSPKALKLAHGKRRVAVEYRDREELHTEEFELDGLGANSAFSELLNSRQIETIHSQETTLEGVFIEVTGRALS